MRSEIIRDSFSNADEIIKVGELDQNKIFVKCFKKSL
jgi:hypothetical protein